MEDIQQVLQTRDDQALCDLIKNEKFISKIKDNPWKILSSIINHINETVAQENIKFYESLLKAVEVFTASIDPDDVILILIKEIPDVKIDSTLIVLLKSVNAALLKLLPKNKISYLTWSLNAVQMYLDEVAPPDNLNLEENEKLLMDADAVVGRISTLYYELLPFYNTLVSAIVAVNYKDHKVLLLRSILQLLGHPLVYLDMDIQEKPKSKARLVAENFVYKILILHSDPYSFLEESFCSGHEDVKIKQVSLSVFYYLHLAEVIGLEKSPKVYDPMYIFQNTLTYVVPLLLIEHQFAIEKGLKLITYLLKLISSYTLPFQLLDSDIHCKFCKSITAIIIYNTVESYRKQSLNIFHNYLYKFDSRGRYLLIYNITRSIDNVSLTAYNITQYKEMLVEQLDRRVVVDYYFQGPKLITLLSMFCSLPEGVESDLIKSADQIIASLNLLRYLVLRDKRNVTGIWNHVKQLQKSFLDPLKEALILSKAHYNLKLKEIADENAHGDKVNSDNKLSVTIEGKHLPELTANEKIKVVNSSLTAFDVIDSLLSRLNECIDYSDGVNETK